MEVDRALVSVITPMYNVSGVLHLSFNSVVSQTLHNIEYILVDDCCSDNSLEVLQKLRNCISRDDISYKVLHHDKNRGVAAARNTGLDSATGKYIYFLDSDDQLDSNALEVMVDLADVENADIIGCDWKQTFADSEKTQTQPEVASPDDAFCKLANGVMRWNLWLYLIRRELYDGMRFIEKANMGEDMMLILKMVLNAKKIIQTHQIHYHYNVTNSNALTKSYMKHKEEMDINQANLKRYLEDNRPDLLPNIYQLQLALKLPLLISDKREDYNTWLQWFPEANTYVRDSIFVSKRIKLLQIMASKKQFWFIRLHYWLIIKVVYGIMYR